MRTRFQLQRSTCSRADCNAFVSPRQAFTRTLSVLQASRPHLEEVNLLPGAAAPGNSPGNSHPSTDRNEILTWSFLSPIPSHKIWCKSVQFFGYRGHRQTGRHTYKPTPVKIYSLAFAGIIT